MLLLVAIAIMVLRLVWRAVLAVRHALLISGHLMLAWGWIALAGAQGMEAVFDSQHSGEHAVLATVGYAMAIRRCLLANSERQHDLPRAKVIP